MYLKVENKEHYIEELISKYLDEYSIKNEPISVSFRDIIPELNRIDRYSHLIHSYPAKLLAHIPYFFLNNNFFSKKDDVILDPFSGTGTVLLEALASGRNAIGADANPLARLIAKVKMTNYNILELEKQLLEITKLLNSGLETIIPNVVNINHWFSKPTQEKLGRLLFLITNIKDDTIKDFFLVSFSNCVKKVSYADPRISVPVKINPSRFEVGSDYYNKLTQRIVDLENIDVFSLFIKICRGNIKRINVSNQITNRNDASIISVDARKLTKSIDSQECLLDESVDFIITSPPYAGAQKYIRSSSLNIGWIGLDSQESIRELDKKNIGRENYYNRDIKKIETGLQNADNILGEIYEINPNRAYIVGNYLEEMKIALSESIRVLKKNSYFVIIIGNNTVCGKEFKTENYISEYLINKGLKLQLKLIDDIKSRGLMTKRNKTANVITREWILIFKK